MTEMDELTSRVQSLEGELVTLRESIKAANDEEKCKLLYPPAVALITASEATTWSRVTSFLTITGLICTAYSISRTSSGKLALALAGVGLSAIYFALLLRSRLFVERHITYARRLETEMKFPTLKDLGAEFHNEGGVVNQVRINHPITGAMVALAIPTILFVVFLAMALNFRDW